MNQTSVEHNTFVIERSYDAPIERVYAAWAEPEAKSRWFGIPDGEYALDFRVGGRELNRGSGPDGRVFTYDARYQDIVVDQRIVFAYSMLADETLISVSLATVEFAEKDSGTRLLYTEQGAFLDGNDNPHRRKDGTRGLLEALGRQLEKSGG